MGERVRRGGLSLLAGAGGRVPVVAPPAGDEQLGLGAVQVVPVGEDLFVANVIGQHGYRRSPDGPAVRYEAIGTALAALGEAALELGASEHMPRIGCGLAGGRWELIAPLIDAHLTCRSIAVTVYDLQP